MRTKRRQDSFWLSYSDLMTSLFFIMLVLFIVCIIKMKGTQNELRTTLEGVKVENERLVNILQLENQFKELSQSSALRYDDIHKTFIAKDFEGIEIFEHESAVIKPEYLKTVDKVGRDLNSLLSKLNGNNTAFKYLLVIEGNSANKDNDPWSKDREYNYKLSYERSLALYNRWTQVDKIDLRQYNTEIQICGSGLNGINRDEENENNNKRFVIQIIPKVSKPEN